MENGTKVSIVMPVFNAVKYIEKTLQSIINQTYRNYELLIIDDGATDGTELICQRYAKKYDNIFYHKQNNAGTCTARNRGIKLATGDYIAFSDHDDEYLPQYLEVMTSLARKYDLDVVKCGVYFEEEYADGTMQSRCEKFHEEIVSQKELVRRYNSLPISFFGVWNTLYRSSMVKSNNVFFPTEVKHGQEDYFFNTEVIPFAQKFGFSGESLYKHFRRIEQSTSAKFYDERIEHMALYFKRECEVLKPLIESEEWPREYGILYARKVSGVLSYVMRTNHEDANVKCKDELKRYFEAVPYAEKISFPIWFSIFQESRLYALILSIIQSGNTELLVWLWKVKNRKGS